MILCVSVKGGGAVIFAPLFFHSQIEFLVLSTLTLSCTLNVFEEGGGGGGEITYPLFFAIRSQLLHCPWELRDNNKIEKKPVVM